jgi:hypothetical protein
MPVFNKLIFIKHMYDLKYIAVILCVQIFALLMMLKMSAYIYSFSVFLIILESINVLAASFNKVTLVLFSAYICVSYFFSLLLKDEVNRACYNPNYSESNLFDPLLIKFNCILKTHDGASYPAILTNWDETSAFIKLTDEQLPKFTRGNLLINAFDRSFEHKCKVVSNKNKIKGIGLEFMQLKSSNKNNWHKFVNICKEMCLLPDWLK